MPKYSNNNEPDALIEMMRFITKLADGGHSLIYTGVGALILMVYAFSLYYTKNAPVLIPVIGVGMCLMGVLFFFLTRKKSSDGGNPPPLPSQSSVASK